MKCIYIGHWWLINYHNLHVLHLDFYTCRNVVLHIVHYHLTIVKCLYQFRRHLISTYRNHVKTLVCFVLPHTLLCFCCSSTNIQPRANDIEKFFHSVNTFRDGAWCSFCRQQFRYRFISRILRNHKTNSQENGSHQEISCSSWCSITSGDSTTVKSCIFGCWIWSIVWKWWWRFKECCDHTEAHPVIQCT